MVIDKSYQRRAFNLANAIQQRARGWWNCHGNYCLIISGRPYIPKPTSNAGVELILIANKFIDKTARVEFQVCEEVFKCEDGSIMIQNASKVYCGKISVLFCDQDKTQAPVV